MVNFEYQMAEADTSFLDDDDFTHVINGIRYPRFVTEANLEAMATFDIRDDDIAIVTFPKTGVCDSVVSDTLYTEYFHIGSCFTTVVILYQH